MSCMETMDGILSLHETQECLCGLENVIRASKGIGANSNCVTLCGNRLFYSLYHLTHYFPPELFDISKLANDSYWVDDVCIK